jgi:hypothetical protein
VFKDFLARKISSLSIKISGDKLFRQSLSFSIVFSSMNGQLEQEQFPSTPGAIIYSLLGSSFFI